MQNRQIEKAIRILEWLAAMCSHIPNRGEQMVKYYGYYSNVSRGNGRRKAKMMLSPASLNHRETKRHLGKAGHD